MFCLLAVREMTAGKISAGLDCFLVAIIPIQYIFTSANGSREFFDLRLNNRTLNPVNDPPDELPFWTKLNFHQCPHFPLSVAVLSPSCPLSIQLVNSVKEFHPPLSLPFLDQQKANVILRSNS